MYAGVTTPLPPPEMMVLLAAIWEGGGQSCHKNPQRMDSTLADEKPRDQPPKPAAALFWLGAWAL